MTLLSIHAARKVRPSCVYCPVKDMAPCGASREPAWVAAMDAAHSPSRRVRSGEAIFGPGSTATYIYTILSGWVALYETFADGRSLILNFALPGDILSVDHQGLTSARSAIAVGEASVCAISLSRHNGLRRDHPQFNERHIGAVGRELNFAYDHLAQIALGTARERVLRLIWELGSRSLRRRPLRNECISMPLSQIQLALATGLTPVHISRTLRGLREDGLLELESHVVRIHDPAEVERLAGVSDETMAMWAHRPALSDLVQSVLAG